MPSEHAHSKSTETGRAPSGRKVLPLATLSVALVLVGVAVAAYALRTPSGRAAASPPSTVAHGVDTAVNQGPFTVATVTPTAGAAAVPTDATLSVQFSAPLSPTSPTPTLTPAAAGAWREVTPDTFAFVPSAPFVPSTTETISVPAGDGGVTSAGGKSLGAPVTATFSVASGTTLRLQQLLAQLGYLPLSFTPARALSAPQEAAQAQEGTFDWRWTEPASLVSLWTVGSANEITRGAVMAFESQRGMKTDGVAGPAVWQQLLGDAAAGTMYTSPYNYVFVSKSLPETTTVYSNGAAVYSTRANTGVPAAPTASGTFPVYLRYKVTTMSGTNPDGSKYVDPGIPWVSYFNGGDALHGFVRGGYGYPQSDGCVEMPPANAAVVYPLTPIGTLVTVS
jgi:peptidoglycan hydrolase-like protein with peptidoglycan-binding domain